MAVSPAEGRDLQVILRSLTAFEVVLKLQAEIATLHHQGAGADLSRLSFGRRNCPYHGLLCPQLFSQAMFSR